MGLATAIGGTYTVGHDNRLIACAQQYDHEISDNGNTVIAGSGFTHVSGGGVTLVSDCGETEVIGSGVTRVTGRGETHVSGRGNTLVDGSGDTSVVRGGCVAVSRRVSPDVIRRELIVAPVRRDGAPRDVQLYNVGTATIDGAQQVDINCACPVTHSGTGGTLTVTGGTVIQANGNNQITARENSHIMSFSSNELDHQGFGSVNVDNGDIRIGVLDDESLTRTVEVNEANSVTVAPGISTHIQNGTEFTIGRTAQETLGNLQRAMGLPLGRGSNAQRPQSSNCALKFIISVIVALWTFSFGTLFGGSGGSK